jgi:hypothetical protein
MSWQDLVMSFGGFFVAASLLPMLRAREKPPLTTSGPLVVILAAIGVALYTLDLRLAALSTVVQGALWAMIALARLRPPRTPAA